MVLALLVFVYLPVDPPIVHPFKAVTDFPGWA